MWEMFAWTAGIISVSNVRKFIEKCLEELNEEFQVFVKECLEKLLNYFLEHSIENFESNCWKKLGQMLEGILMNVSKIITEKIGIVNPGRINVGFPGKFVHGYLSKYL